ncbi:MAG: hypothetical protein LBR34_05670, partial [Prevotella sp.]|nr:hypothetical protein [Prevotella sp.]
MKRITIICALLIVSSIVKAQISTEELPVSWKLDGVITQSYSMSYTLPSLNMNIIEQEDAEDEANGLPPRFGYPHIVNYNLDNSGEWTILSNGDKIWMLHIACPGALSINLLYDQFWLPDGAKLFVYSDNGD